MRFTISSRAAKADTRLHMHAFSQEHFVGLQLFCTDDCGHKLSAEKKNIIMFTFFSRSEGS